MTKINRKCFCLVLLTLLSLNLLSEVLTLSYIGGNFIGGGRSSRDRSGRRNSDGSSSDDSYDGSDDDDDGRRGNNDGSRESDSYSDDDDDNDESGIELKTENNNRNVNRISMVGLLSAGAGAAAAATSVTLLPACCCHPDFVAKSCSSCTCDMTNEACAPSITMNLGFVLRDNGVCPGSCSCTTLTEALVVGSETTFFVGCASNCTT